MIGYGAGSYGGDDYGGVGIPTAYGTGTYGVDTYGGAGLPVIAAPVMDAPPPTPGPAAHLMAVGPWSPNTRWAAANYGYRAALERPGMPVMSLPDWTAASFTLRAGAGSEARVELAQARDAALVVDEMVTDLWWQRVDPATGVRDMIGRYNADAVDVSAGDDRVQVSVTWADYRTLIEARLVFENRAWTQPTELTEILRWAIPVNTGVDLSVLDEVTLGKTGEPFEVRLGTSVGDVIRSLSAMGPGFEWAVEQPDDVRARPRMRLWPGVRGTDRGVTIVDTGQGWSPVTRWARRTNAQDYANAVFLSGKFGGSLAVLDATYLPEGQRDAAESDAAAVTVQQVDAAARKLLAERSVIRPSWTLSLAPGFWRGRGHIDVGDVVRLVMVLGHARLTATHRVEEISVSITPDGGEDVSLVLGAARPSANPASRQSVLGRIAKRLRTGGTV